MQKYLIIILVLWAWILSSCTPVRVTYTSNQTRQNLNTYKTFAFAELERHVKVNRANSESVREYVRHAVINELKTRGVEMVAENENPDLLVDLQTNLVNYQREESSQTRYSSRRSYYYNYGFGYAPGSGRLETSEDMEVLISFILANGNDKQKLREVRVKAGMSRNGEKSAGRLDEAVDLLIEEVTGR